MFDLTLARPADAVRHDGNFNAAACGTDDRDRRAILTVACVACLGVTSAAFMVVVDDGNRPWFGASSDLAIAAQRCDTATVRSRRHECQREVAQVAARRASSPTLLVRH